jgi:hypothetical protein
MLRANFSCIRVTPPKLENLKLFRNQELSLVGAADGARTTRQKIVENQGLTERGGDLCRQIRDTHS